MSPIRIGSCKDEKGKKSFGTLKVAERFDGSSIEMPVVIIGGAKSGARLFATAGIHGDELGGILGLMKAIRGIDPSELRGTLVATPCVNTTAFESWTRESPLDNKDLNRVFPGNPEGTFSERLADLYWKEVCLKMEKDDYWMDCHSTDYPYAEIKGIEDKQLQKKCWEFTESCLNPHLNILTVSDITAGPWKKIYHGALRQFVLERGVTCGCMESKNPESIYLGLNNVMKHLEMIEGSLARPQKVIHSNNNLRHFATKRGLQMPLVRPGDIVSKGQPLLQVMDLYGNIVEEVKATIGGIALVVRNPGPVDPWSPRLHDRYGVLVATTE
jgi:predicted deacylase